MQPIDERAIRGAFVNASLRERNALTLPAEFPELRWERIDFLGWRDPKQPLVGYVVTDLRGLPPLLIHVGGDEVLLDDALGLATRAREAGVDATVREWPAMIHVWHWFQPMLDEADQAIAEIGGFVKARLG